MRTRLLYFSLLFIILVLSVPYSAQNATLWGPGENYEIDYLHSGKLQINNTLLESFENQPSTEFTIQNITNNGYDYIYIGYGEIQRTDSILIQTFNFGGLNLEFPVGGMPVILPLSFGDSEDWLEKFHSQLSLVSQFQDKSNDEIPVLNSSLNDEVLHLNFSSTINGSIDTGDQFFDLPFLYDKLESSTLINGSFTGDLTYKRETGVMFTLNFTINSDDIMNEENLSLGHYFSSQTLDFVAIIPPTSIIDNLTAGSSLSIFIFGIAIITIIRKKFR